MEDRTPRPRVDNHSSVTRLDEDKVKFDAGSCEELGKASMKCLSDIGYDKDKATVVCKVHYDAYRCLLYTSPSPRDGLLSRMPSSA